MRDKTVAKGTLLGFFAIAHEVFYFLLLPWPVFVVLAYVLFAGNAKIIFILLVFFLETAQGAFIIVQSLGRMLKRKTFRSKLHFGILGISFVTYIVTVTIYLVSVYSSFLK